MTTLIKQLNSNDCVLACVAMAMGAQNWHDVWTEADLGVVTTSCGTHIHTELERVGFKRDVDFKDLSLYDGAPRWLSMMLWKRRAILSVDSLNIDRGSHAVYWDGEELFDPSTARTFQFLSSLKISGIVLLSDSVRIRMPSAEQLNADDHHAV